MKPWVRKTQNNKKFGQRRADGLGDIAVINNISMLSFLSRDRLAAWVGLKFATGDVEDPRGTSKLPNPFQSGSGAEDLFVGMNYFRSLGRVQVYGRWLSRLPPARRRDGVEHRRRLVGFHARCPSQFARVVVRPRARPRSDLRELARAAVQQFRLGAAGHKSSSGFRF